MTMIAIMKIEKKAWPEMFQAVANGKKNFDLRLADFEIKEGDILVLKEWDPATKEYTGRTIEKEIGYVLKTKGLKFWNENEVDKYGYQVISFK